jgi:hypothetical protein
MRKISVTGIVLGILAAMFIGNVKAEEHGHPARDMEIHHKFYNTWMMPQNRTVSCCHEEDCAPAESKFENGQWLARKDSEPNAEFTPVPPERIEKERDTPDGRSHVCGRRYGFSGGTALTIFCFLPGAGG